MKIGIYNIYIYANNTSSKAKVSITIDDAIAINDIILKEHDGKYYLLFPNCPNNNRQGERHQIVHPVSISAKDQILNSILAEYLKIKKI